MVSIFMNSKVERIEGGLWLLDDFGGTNRTVLLPCGNHIHARLQPVGRTRNQGVASPCKQALPWASYNVHVAVMDWTPANQT